MNKEQFEKELDMKLASLKEEMMQKFEEQEDEFPKYLDKYYYLTSSGNIDFVTCIDDVFDKNRLAIGNFFETEKEAKFESERRKVIAELKKYAEPKDREWGNCEIIHYCIAYDCSTNKICIDTKWIFKNNSIYFESKEKAKKAIKEVGENKVKKYYLGVEE